MSNSHRNVLVLIADDWSPIAGCYGNSLIQTPNIDAFAEQAVTFDFAFCSAPTCAVSRASLLTGQHSHTHGQYGHCHNIHGFRTHEWMLSLPALLGRNGYATGLIGKNHVAPRSVYPFDDEPRVDMHSPADMAAQMTRFFDDHRDKPFYLHVASIWPHRARSFFGADGKHNGYEQVKYDPADVVVPDFLPDNDATRADLAEYYSAISGYDQFVGACLRALRDSGRADETMVMVMTDHAMPWPGAKMSSYDTGHRCPFIIQVPGLEHAAAKRNQAIINWVDTYPTILDWCGVEYSEDAEPLPGRSLLSVVDDHCDVPGGGAWEQTFFSHCFHEVTNYYPYRVLRGRRYKLVRNLAHQLPSPLASDLFRSATWQRVLRDDIKQLGRRDRDAFMHQPPEVLYDMRNDPMETTNIIDDPELTHIVADMREQLMDFRVRTKDPWLELSWQHGEPGVPER